MGVSAASSLRSPTRAHSPAISAGAVWLPILVGAVLLYLPAYIDLTSNIATNEGSSQQPICVLIWLWMIWRQRSLFGEFDLAGRGGLAGWALVIIAALLYVVGRSQDFFQFEIGSQVPLFAGVVLILLGAATLRKLWFPTLFLAFIVPFPGSLLNDLLVPLKKFVSTVVAQLLYMFG